MPGLSMTGSRNYRSRPPGDPLILHSIRNRTPTVEIAEPKGRLAYVRSCLRPGEARKKWLWRHAADRP